MPIKEEESTSPTGLVKMSAVRDRSGRREVQVGLTLFSQPAARKVAYEILEALAGESEEDRLRWEGLSERTNSALAFRPSA